MIVAFGLRQLFWLLAVVALVAFIAGAATTHDGPPAAPDTHSVGCPTVSTRSC